MRNTRFFRKIFHSFSLQVKKFTYSFKSSFLSGFVFKLNLFLRIYSLQYWRKQKLKLMFMKSWGIKKREAEKKKKPKQVEMLPTWLLMKGKVGEDIQFLFHPISLRSWFTDLKNVSFKLSYFFPLCASFKLQFFLCPISSLWDWLGWPTQIATWSLFIMNQSFAVAVGDFNFRWVSYSNSYSQGHTK